MRKLFVVSLLSLLWSIPSFAQMKADDAWIRATVPGQTATGMFVRLTSDQDVRLIAVSSPVAGLGEIHEMTMDGEVMKMRAVDGIDLPAGQTVELKPGGLHIMLLDLKEPLQEGQNVLVSLVIEKSEEVLETVQMEVPVRALTSKPATH